MQREVLLTRIIFLQHVHSLKLIAQYATHQSLQITTPLHLKQTSPMLNTRAA